MHDIRFDESLPNHVDWDIWLDVFALSPEIFYVDEALAVYRTHGSSLTRNLLSMKMGFLQAIEKQLLIHRQNPKLKRLFLQKRALTLERYDSLMGIQGWGLKSRLKHKFSQLRKALSGR